jgi:hypothetical protein
METVYWVLIEIIKNKNKIKTMNKKIYFMLSLLLVITIGLKAQVVIGTNAAEPESSAVLDLNSGINGDLGLLLPRVPLTAEDDDETIPSPATGLMVYSTGTAGLAAGVYVWDGTQWETEGSKVSNKEDYPATPPAGVSVSLSGTSCFDVRTALVEDAEYRLTVTGAQSIDKVTWEIIESSNIQRSAATSSNTMTTLHFMNQPDVLSSAPSYIIITTYVDYTNSNGDAAKLSVTKNVSFKKTACCPGTVVPNAVYTGSANMGGTSWTAAQIRAHFTKTNQDLCVSNPAAGFNAQYYAVGKAYCDNLASPEQAWRYPNAAEALDMRKSGLSGQAVNSLWTTTYGNVNWRMIIVTGSETLGYAWTQSGSDYSLQSLKHKCVYTM